VREVRDVHQQFIGTGSSECCNFYNTNLLVQYEEKRLLIDCGWTAKQALGDLNLSITDIDAIYITHVHGDHVFGLERFGFEGRYVHNCHRIKLYVPKSVFPLLWDETLKGSMGYSSDGENTLEDFFDVELVEDKFTWQGLSFQLFATPHTKGKPSFGLRLPHRFTFTSDSNVIGGFAQLVEDDAYIFHDAYSAGDFHPAHATLQEMRDAYQTGLLKRIHLVHYDDAIATRGMELCDFAGWVEQGKVFRC